MAHMVASGYVLHDPLDVMVRLRSAAIRCLDGGPQVSREKLKQLAYLVTTNFEDAVDIADVDADRSRVLVISALDEAAKLAFLKVGRWIPRSKALFSELDSLHPHLAMATRRAIAARTTTEAIASAEPVIQDVAGAIRFFEWQTKPQHLEE